VEDEIGCEVRRGARASALADAIVLIKGGARRRIEVARPFTGC
jgi:hypothetical protein